MKKFFSKKIFHIGFEIGLILKGLNAFGEIIGGSMMFLLTPDRLNRLMIWLTQSELSQDPKDVVANALMAFGQSFSISTQYFVVFYLLSHGITKGILVFLLWKKKLWAYPLAIILLLLFIAYQVYRYTFSPSIFLIVLTGFDMIMIALTYIEYNNLKARLVVESNKLLY